MSMHYCQQGRRIATVYVVECMAAHIKEPEHLTDDLKLMDAHLQAMTDELCRKV